MYSLLLHLYPASFRNEYGDEMRAVFARRRREAAASLGAIGAVARDDRRRDRATRRWCTRICSARISRYTGAHAAPRARASPLTAIVIVALGIGATTAAFSVTDFVLLRPLPFPAAGSAGAAVREDAGLLAARALAGELSRLESGRARSFESIGLHHARGRPTSSAAASRSGWTGPRCPTICFRRCGVQPLIGRLFTESRRSRRRAGHADPQLPAVADAVRRRPVDRRPAAAARRRVVHRHRRHAAGVPLSDQRGAVLDAAALQRADVRRPQRQLALRGRAAARRRDARAGAGRDGRARGAIEAAVPGGEQGRRRAADRRSRRRRVAAGAAAAATRCRARRSACC